MIVITRHTVAPEDSEDFAARAAAALEVLSRRPGYRRGSLARAADDPALWTLVTEWDGPGAYRRALSDFDVKVSAVPLLSTAHDEASAFEVLAVQGPAAD
ncbi:antibiotic biosynthesis monooxygenase [Thermobifida alba]|uniref:Antibiotic biosynthesis monooxygenase n=1 Tax=Thermobifida alba TaxID=53522 RepID=A0ABY4KW95_THEAE|nr:antibiotic biosynthesis monooxygenase [Thermobifida alba]UPT19699.1 antibiotic biosynthesis monooxygenase [Thermobifida alba]HLU95960.1 antibiotic biosynthesis monooxygenase [Thermobifida alba]